MTITKTKLDVFYEMVDKFARANGLDTDISNDNFDSNDPITYITIRKPHSPINPHKRYYIRWREAESLTDAATSIFSDAMVFFGLTSTSNAYSLDIKDVIFNNPATIVLWSDGTKSVVKCQERDEYSREVGLALCIAKKALGNKGNFNNVFRKWIRNEDVRSNSESDYFSLMQQLSEFKKQLDALGRINNGNNQSK